MLITFIQKIPTANQAGLDKFIFGQASTLLMRDVKLMIWIDFAAKSLLFHLHNHEENPDEALENDINTIYDHLHWQRGFLDRLVKQLVNSNYVALENNILKLTDQGRAYAIQSYEQIVAGMQIIKD